MMDSRRLRVFLSSPGDVAEERQLAREVLQSLQRQPLLNGRVTIEVVSWDDPDAPAPMFATLTPQEAVNRGLPKPSECDLTVVILWSRMGTPLSEPRKADGSQYLSGTEWEYEDAANAGRDVLLYRRTSDPQVSLRDPDLQEKLKQQELVDQFFERFKGRDGTLTGGFTTFETPAELEKRLEQDVESYLRNQLDGTAGQAQAQSGQSAAPEVPASYLAWLQEECASIELLGLRLKQGQAVRLSSVYVPLATTGGERAAGADNERMRREALAPGERERVTLLLDRLGESSLYVSGDPGSGKSTFCRWVAWLACDGDVPEHNVEADVDDTLLERWPEALRNRLPVLVRLREFWETLPPGEPGVALTGAALERLLLAWVEQTERGGLRGAHLQVHLERGSALLLLDGVDEVPAVQRAALIAGLGEAAARWTTAGNRLLVTSRPYGLTEGDIRRLGLPHAPIQALPDSLQRLLVRRWFGILADAPEAGDAAGAEMLRQVGEQAWLSPLTANPLLLTAMCIVFNDGKKLPQDKYELYDRLVETVLYGRISNTSDIARVRDRLAVVAYGMHTGADLDETRMTPRAQATDAEIERLLRAYQERSAWSETVQRSVFEAREELVSQTGLLVPQGEHRAGFYHLSFQEFLAARRLADVEAGQLLEVALERGAVREWRNTLSFLFGQVLATSTSPERAVGLLSDLIGRVGTADTAVQVVAADWIEILAGRGYRLDPTTHQRAVDLCLASMRGDAPAGDRCELGAALGRMGDPRFREDAWFLPDEPLLGFVEVPAGPFRMGSDKPHDSGALESETPQHEVTLPGYYIARYPVTVAQFRAYLEDSGRTPENPESLRGPASDPVVHVTWHEAVAYGNWLTETLGASNEAPADLRRVLRGDGVERPRF